MTTPHVQSFVSLRDEMIAVARGERKAPKHAAEPSVHSADLIARLLTPENRLLMSTIRDQRPESVAALAMLTHRAASNLTRTLDKLAAVGLVTFATVGRRKAPRAVAGKIVIEIDPFSLDDTIRVVKPTLKRRPAARSVKVTAKAAAFDKLRSRKKHAASSAGTAKRSLGLSSRAKPEKIRA
jgi:predicted transcriptional regulator